MRLHQHRSGPGLIPARLSLPFLACHAGVCSPRVPSHVHSCCVSFNAAASMLAPVFPGCHVICRPATYHGIEPPPFLPSLDKRAGIEPALSLLVAGGDPRLSSQSGHSASLPEAQPPTHHLTPSSVAHHHCAFTNIEAPRRPKQELNLLATQCRFGCATFGHLP